ncbi:hypothetical protein [Chryseobacterium sp. KCF3-3]|uniref:hypothetical protein n=1 Tax=Chryseobacterium sp. KCF3-3 TaxID=3231511 RepID=UPI0038B3BD50
MKNRVINIYIVEIEEHGIKKFVKMYVTDAFCYLETFHKGMQIITRISEDKATQLINKAS